MAVLQENAEGELPRAASSLEHSRCRRISPLPIILYRTCMSAAFSKVESIAVQISDGKWKGKEATQQ